MKRNRDFHKQVRVVYRACRRLYGLEKTQDECLKLFMIIFPEMYKARLSDQKYYRISDSNFDKVDALFTNWIPEEGALRDLLCEILNELDRLMFREEFISYCNDIMPVAMRIRKLTPRECFRLMDVDDKDIDTLLESLLSNSALYRLAGNSICISPMFHMFRKLFIDTGMDIEKGKPQQLMLF